MSTIAQRNGSTLFEDLMGWMGSISIPEFSSPEVRVEEFVDGDRRVVRADMPGIDPERDLELHVEGGVLRLRGERRSEEHEQHHTEIRYGSFERILSLPPGTTPEDITAEYVDGVLTVTMPAKAAAVSAKIPVTHRELPAE